MNEIALSKILDELKLIRKALKSPLPQEEKTCCNKCTCKEEELVLLESPAPTGPDPYVPCTAVYDSEGSEKESPDGLERLSLDQLYTMLKEKLSNIEVECFLVRNCPNEKCLCGKFDYKTCAICWLENGGF